jgi:hypothetical protein
LQKCKQFKNDFLFNLLEEKKKKSEVGSDQDHQLQATTMLARIERPQRPVPSSPASSRKGGVGAGENGVSSYLGSYGHGHGHGRPGGRAQEITHDALWKAMRTGQRDDFHALLSRGTHNVNRRDDDDVRTSSTFILFYFIL